MFRFRACHGSGKRVSEKLRRRVGDKPDDGFLSGHCPVIVDLSMK